MPKPGSLSLLINPFLFVQTPFNADEYSDIYSMCGIAGIVQSGISTYDLGHVKKMTDALAHRGPDGEAQWHNPNNTVLLGHRRLAIIDLSNEAAQPMHYKGRYSIIHNGEIYNYKELRIQLAAKGYAFTTQSDTEVILAAYDCWNDECVTFFDGMFAFAIWDEQEQELFAARDRFGEKPLYYFFDGNTFMFASEMKALWAAGVERQPNLQMHFNFITIGYTDNPEDTGETFYNNIHKLPAAHRLYFDIPERELSVERYWDIDPRIKNKKITDAEALEHFNELLTTSVQRRLRSDVGTGASLSGGLDSSSIAAIASAGNASSFHTFTATFNGYEKNELPHAQAIAKQFSLPHHTIDVTIGDLVQNWEKLCYHQEEPFGSSSIFAQYKVYELARQHGIKVLLDGQGADETLAGYHKYYKWFWQELFIKRKLISSGELKAASALGVQEKFSARNIIASLFPDVASVLLERRYLVKALRQEDLTREFVKEQSREAYYTTPDISKLNGALYFNTCTHGLEELLRYADRNSMAHGREVRLPFLSHELVEFVFSLPAHFKIRQGWTKWLLRKNMEQTLAPEVVWRKDKVGFEPPQRSWMQDTRLIEKVKESRVRLVKEKILKPFVIDKPVLALDAHAANNFDWRYLNVAAFL